MEDKEFSYINAVPLIDVMLVLLTITLTTATFVTHGAIKVNLPSALSAQEKEPVMIDIYMTSDKKLYIDKTQVDENALEKELSVRDKESLVVISADKTLSIDELTRVLGHVQNSGFKKMSIKTQIPSS
ncbi:MAG: biopolymer transporter ExbD [Campylobacteraceae bacterium]|jgi:biopolymer transport protein ExbD|nr:biopolymer transporter ExbD [Campylobacteraceae bacterium]